MKSDNFFIFDSQGHIVGNPKGYPTHKGAETQANRALSPAGRALWAAYKGPGRLYAIATLETARAKGYTK